MADKKKVGIAGSILSLLVVVGTYLAHEAGAASHDLGGAIGGVDHHVPEIPVPHENPVHVPEVPAGAAAGSDADTTALIRAIQQGRKTFQALQNGSDFDQEVVAAACAVMNTSLGYTQTATEVKKKVYSYMPEQMQPGKPANAFVAKPVNTVSNYLAAVSELPGGAARYYAVYCGPKFLRPAH